MRLSLSRRARRGPSGGRVRPLLSHLSTPRHPLSLTSLTVSPPHSHRRLEGDDRRVDGLVQELMVRARSSPARVSEPRLTQYFFFAARAHAAGVADRVSRSLIITPPPTFFPLVRRRLRSRTRDASGAPPNLSRRPRLPGRALPANERRAPPFPGPTRPLTLPSPPRILGTPGTRFAPRWWRSCVRDSPRSLARRLRARLRRPRRRTPRSLADALASFDEAPFTVQRLCELLLAPTAYYAKPDKLTRAVEKLLNVTGMVPSPTAPPTAPSEPEETAPSSPARRAAKDPTHVQQTAFVSSLVGVAAGQKTAREDDVQNDLFGGVGEDAAVVWEIERRRRRRRRRRVELARDAGWRRMSSPPRRERRRDRDGDRGGERDGENHEMGESFGMGGD